MPYISRPIPQADLAFYEGHLVLLTARAMAQASPEVWAAMPLRRRLRWERKALAVVYEILSDKTVIERLPQLVRNLQSRL